MGNIGVEYIRNSGVGFNPWQSVEQIENFQNTVGKYVKATTNFLVPFIESVGDMFTKTYRGLEEICGFKDSSMPLPSKVCDSLGKIAKQGLEAVSGAIDDLEIPRGEVQYPVKFESVYEDEVVRLLRCRMPNEEFNDGKPIIFTTPVMRGMNLLTLKEGDGKKLKSILIGANQKGFDTYITNWKGTSDIRDYGMREYFDSTHKFAEEVLARTGQVPAGVHICNYGYMALLALAEKTVMYPNVLAGTPIDLKDGYLVNLAKKVSEETVQLILNSSNGMMRGDDLVRFWKQGKMEDILSNLFAPLNAILDNMGDNVNKESAEAYKRWLNLDTRDIPGKLYKEILSIFRENLLMQPKSILGIDTRNYKAPLIIVTGENDDISPHHQCIAAKDIVGTPQQFIMSKKIPKTGHSGLYMSSASVREWIVPGGIFDTMIDLGEKYKEQVGPDRYKIAS